MSRHSFTIRISLAMALAVIVGFAFQISGHGDAATRFIAPVGTVFLNLVKFIVCPLVLFSVMAGTVSMNNLKKGKQGTVPCSERRSSMKTETTVLSLIAVAVFCLFLALRGI